MTNVKSRQIEMNNRSKLIDAQELGSALRNFRDLPILEGNALTDLPCVRRRAESYPGSLGKARALRSELISCAEELTVRSTYPIEKIVSAMKNGLQTKVANEMPEIIYELNIPFSRSNIDLARYYSIRLVMEGMNIQNIAEFLQVEPRTVANYIKQAKQRIEISLINRF